MMHKALYRSRSIVLVDIENLADTSRPTVEDVVAVRTFVDALGVLVPGQHVVIACHPGNGLAVALGWPGVRYLWRAGQDGADLALLDVVANEDIPIRFDRVTVCSGDAIFALAIDYLAKAGCSVDVVGGTGRSSYRLWRRSRVVRTIPAPSFQR